MRNRAWRRHKNYTKALRKKKINSYWTTFYPWWYYDNLHQYSKNKIHCSCGMCSTKTRNKGHRRALPKNYAPSINYKHSELKRQLAMSQEEKEFRN